MLDRFKDKDLKEILIAAKNNDDAASRYLIGRYKPMINAIINRGFFLKNGDRDDLFAEGLIGLSRAIKDFDETKSNADGFQQKMESFFYMCIHRALISAIKSANRKKNSALNNMTSLDRPLQENDNLTAMDIIAARGDVQDNAGFEFISPEEQLFIEDTIETSRKMLNESLSDNERDVYELRLQKYSYKEIQEALGFEKIKPIDNALQRIKIKLNNIIEQEEKRTMSPLRGNDS